MSKKTRQLVDSVLAAHRLRLGDIAHVDSIALAHLVAILRAPHLGAITIEQIFTKGKK